jgi:radical SAM superfamily enzyme YgiQ (UPF0313 family)
LKKKVLLLNAPSSSPDAPPIPPLGLLYLAASLQSRGFEVRVIDLDLEREKAQAARIAEICREFSPNLVGISGLTPQMDNLYALARGIKSALPSVPLVCGGAHASALPEQTMKECPQLDAVVTGEGELSFASVAEGKEFSEIPGAWFREGGKIVRGLPQAVLHDLDSIPLPARELIDLGRYEGWSPFKQRPSTHIIASRGCPFNCVYCSEKAVFGFGHRRRSPKKVVDEIQMLIEKYGIREIAFYDDLFTANKQWVMDICNEILSRKLKFSWKALSRVDTVSQEMLDKMKEAGCWLVFFGYESGSQRILDNINKKIRLEQSLEATKMARKAGLKAFGFFMIGNKGDTPETIRETISFAHKVRPDFCQFSIVRPDPGSPLYMEFKSEIEAKHISWGDYYAFPKDTTKMPLVGTNLSAEELMRFRDIALFSFYKRSMAKDALVHAKRREVAGLVRRVRDVYVPALKYSFFPIN